VFGSRPEHQLTLLAPALTTTTTTTSTRLHCRPTVPVPRSSRGPSSRPAVANHAQAGSSAAPDDSVVTNSPQAVGPGSGSSRRPNDSHSGCCAHDGDLVVGRRSLAPVKSGEPTQHPAFSATAHRNRSSQLPAVAALTGRSSPSPHAV